MTIHGNRKTAAARRRGGEKGFALLTVLMAVLLGGVLVAGAVAVSLFDYAEADSYVAIIHSRYEAEGALNRIIADLRRGGGSGGEGRRKADAKFNHGELYGRKFKYRVADANAGIDLASATDTGNFAGLRRIFQTDHEQFLTLCDRLGDYCDSDDIPRLNGMESRHYAERGMNGMPRSGKMQYREEVIWVPGFEVTAAGAEGELNLFNVIPPRGMRSYGSGGIHLPSASPATISLICGLSEEDAENVAAACKAYREGKGDYDELLAPELYTRLMKDFSLAESGILSIYVQVGEDESPGCVLTAVLPLSLYRPRLEFYEIMAI